MKTILALAFLVAMLALPPVVAAPGGDPNGNAFNGINPATILSGLISENDPQFLGPGLSEIGVLINSGIVDRNIVSTFAPGHSPE